MLKRFSLQTKLRGLCLLLAFFTVMSGSLAFFSLHRVTNISKHVSHTSLVRVQASLNFLSHYRQARIGLLRLGLPHLSEEDAASAKSDVTKGVQAVDDDFKSYLSVDFEPGKKFGAGERELFESFQRHWKDFKDRQNRVLAAYDEGHIDAVENILSKEDPPATRVVIDIVDKLIDYVQVDARKSVAVSESTANQSNLWMAIIVLVSLACGLGIGYLVAHWIARELHAIADTLDKDTNQLNSTSTEVARASIRLSESSTEQAAALQETTASLEETSAMIGKNADNARRSTTVSSSSQASAEKGREAVEQMIRSIAEISDSNDRILKQVESSNREMSQIVTVINNIGDKTKVINDIVFQTKLLSFNASVEAARAGEHGKGFAVVAEEVGNLAQMSGNAAHDITSLLSSSIATVQKIAQESEQRIGSLINEGRAKVAAGRSTAEACGTTLAQIVREVSDVSQMVQEIATASHEQSRGVEEINKAMAQLDQASQENHQVSQAVSHSAERLNHDLSEIRSLVTHLNDLLNGQRGNAPASSHHEPKAKAMATLSVPAKVLPLKTESHVAAAPAPQNEMGVPSRDDARFKDV